MTAAEARELMAEHVDAIAALVDEAPPLPDGAGLLLRDLGLAAAVARRDVPVLAPQDGAP